MAAAIRSAGFARALGLDAAATRRLLGDCLLTGAAPLEAHAWRSVHGGRHPLPARIAGLLLTRLGDPAGHALLADKLATADRLAAAGAAFPAVRVVGLRGEAVGPLPSAAGGGLFVKPRHGHGGRGAFALVRTAGGWHADDRPLPEPALRDRLQRLVRQDDLLLQERLSAAPGLEDLAADGRAPVLRLVTARLPGEAPFLQSALLTMAVPGRDPHHFLSGAVHVPVDPAGGRLAPGLTLAAPQDRLARLPWNGAPLAGRPVPGVAAAVAMTLRAMAALPPLPLVHWDLIPTAAGPVMLEGNSAGNRILETLPGAYGLDAGPLTPLLARWMPPGAAARRWAASRKASSTSARLGIQEL